MSIADTRYVGMGGTTFYDFHLMHRFLGVNRMVSLERDPNLQRRSEFNCPFDFVKVRKQTAAEFLAADSYRKPTIYWFDYDDSMGPSIIADITSLGTKVKVGGFAFVTVCAEPPRFYGKLSMEARLAEFQKEMGDFSVNLVAANMADAEFPNTIHRILVSAFAYAFAPRKDGQFQLLFQVQYKDSVKMITVGGCFCKESDAAPITRRVKSNLPFLLREFPYKMRRLNLTARERLLFDIAVTKKRLNSRQANFLKTLGFKQDDFDTYRDLIRFLPRYSESII